MMGKIVKAGKSFKGCVEYCVLKKDAEVLDATGVRSDKVARMVSDFNMQRKMRESLGQAVGHLALNWSPDDAPKLTDELMVSIAKEYLQKMKITDTQVLMVKHNDQNHPHLHIVYNRVDNQGNTISDAYQRWKNMKISKSLTLQYGFHLGEGKEKVNRQRLKGVDKVKYQIHDLIKELLPRVGSLEELREQLNKQNVSMMYKYKTGTTEVQGVSFSKGKHVFKGSQIDRSLSYGKICAAIAEVVEVKQMQIQRQNREHPQGSGSQSNDLAKTVFSDQQYQTNFFGDVLSNLLKPEVDISDDIDDTVIYRRKRKAKDHGHSHSL